MPIKEGIADCATNAGGRWYVVHTQPWAEDRAVWHLRKQGYQVFCPRQRTVLRHARRTTTALAPLFPRYLFMRLDPLRDPWRCVNGTRGVVHLVGRGEVPQPVPHGIVEGLLDQTGPDGAIDWTRSLKIGQAVCVAAGPFAQFVGTLEHLDGAGRVRVLLELFARSVSVALRSEAIAPAA